VIRDTQVSGRVVAQLDLPHLRAAADVHRRVVPVTQPSVAPRRWLALMSRPTARWPGGQL
jgi:hypothetical protein